MLPEPTPKVLKDMATAGEVVIGDPDECEKAVRTWEGIGADQLSFGMLSTTMPIDVATEAIETFGKHILPKFDTDPVHRTTRLREAQLKGQPVPA